MYYYISMSQNDFLPLFPQKLKSEVLQQSYDNEFRSYTKAIYELCLAEMEEQHFPCYFIVLSPKLLNNDDKAKATEQSTNPDETSINLFNQIDSLIGQHELFKQPRFSLRDLATASGLNEKLLSSLINQQAGKNFNDYINKLRVDAICQHLIQHPEDGKILNIAVDIGFNAKSTFNTAFKKETGLTPSQFVKQHHNNVQNHDSGRETAK